MARAFRVDRVQRDLPFALGERFPGQFSPIVIEHALPNTQIERVLGSAKWGLVPFWAKDPNIGKKLFNARAETLAEKPAFREGFATRRCVVPVSAFYEWQKAVAPATRKQRFTFRAPDGSLLALAGLWATWKAPDQSKLATFTIITVEANQTVPPVHPRMPAMLALDDVARWLAGDTDVETLKGLLRPSPEASLVSEPG